MICQTLINTASLTSTAKKFDKQDGIPPMKEQSKFVDDNHSNGN